MRNRQSVLHWKRRRHLTAAVIGVFVLLALITGSPADGAARSGATLVATVVDAETGDPIIGASLVMVNTYAGAVSDSTGTFRVTSLTAGRYQVRVSHVGYETQTRDSVELIAGETRELSFELKPKPVTLKGIVVTPGQYSIMGEEPTAVQTLSREVIETRPQLSEDLFRAVQRLPGISATDFSAKFSVRGGEQHEVLIMLDGMEIYEPFHLKDVDGGVISVTDIAAMSRVDLMAGGYPANFGGKMSGVFNISSKQARTDATHLSAGLSLMNARLLGEGGFGKDKGSWLLSGRRGYLDLVLDILNEQDQVRPKYYDLFGKLRYHLSPNQVLSASFLHADDNLEYKGTLEEDENNAGDTLYSDYGNSYLWVTLDSYVSPALSARTIASVGRVDHHRTGQVFDETIPAIEMAADDSRTFNLIGLKTDWAWELHPNLLLRSGLAATHASAEYSYEGYRYTYERRPGWIPPYVLIATDTRQAELEKDGALYSAYLSDRMRLLPFLTTELGVRYEHVAYSNDDNLAPRVNIAVELAEKTALKFGWGHFYQSQRIDELSVQDGERDYAPAERAEHFVAELEHEATSGENIRLNIFYKKYEDLRPAYRNTFGELVTFPEFEEDRVEVRFNGKTSRGVELAVRRTTGEKFSWWLNYAYTETLDEISSIYYFAEDVLVNHNKEFPFPLDQQHTLYLDMNYRFSPAWQLNAAWQVHTGWPYTDVHLANAGGTYYLEADEPWHARHDVFKRLDLRLNRKLFTPRGTITAFVEVINVLNDKNVRNYEYRLTFSGGSFSVARSEERWFGPMPSAGISYEYSF